MRQDRTVTRYASFDTEHLRVSETACVTFMILGGLMVLLTLPFALAGEPVFVVVRALGVLFTVAAGLPFLWALVRYRSRLRPVVWLAVAGGVLVNIATWATERPF
jgi:hypothetical protein